MSSFLKRRSYILDRDERGQMAFLMALIIPVIFMFMSLSLDVGVWFFDHRTAQNQADAAALAAVHFLPATDITEAEAAAKTWLAKNRAKPEDLSCLAFTDTLEDGAFDTVRVCVERQSPGIFSKLFGLDFVQVGAVATARVGPAGMSNVKPWAMTPNDPECSNPGQLCYSDLDKDGTLEPCGFYPPIPDDDTTGLGLCPWGLHEDMLYSFKVSSSDQYSEGNFGPIQACGSGGGDAYKDCITGDISSSFYSAGQTVWVDVETGNMIGPTNGGLNDLYSEEATVSPGLPVYENKTERTLVCDVFSTPHPITGMDPDGKDEAVTKWVDEPGPGCARRLISLVIIDEFPNGSGYVDVLGVATFGIARWDRRPKFGDAMGNDDEGQICGQAYPVEDGGAGGYPCGQIWGYFMQAATPPDALLGAMGDTTNPFAPVIYALTE